MGKNRDMTMRERLQRAGILLPAPRVPEPREAPDQARVDAP